MVGLPDVSKTNNVQDLVSKQHWVLNVISKWPDVDNKEYLKDDKGNEYNLL